MNQKIRFLFIYLKRQAFNKKFNKKKGWEEKRTQTLRTIAKVSERTDLGSRTMRTMQKLGSKVWEKSDKRGEK